MLSKKVLFLLGGGGEKEYETTKSTEFLPEDSSFSE